MLKTKRFALPELLPVYLSLAFAIVFILHSLPSSIAQTPGPTSVQNYENPNYGINIQYPKDWTASAIPVYNGIIGFYPPLKNLTDIQSASVSLLVTTYAPTISLEGYTKTYLSTLEQQGVKIDESNPNTLAGNPGHRITYSPTNQETPNAPVNLKIMETWTVMDNKVYLVSFNADTQKFATHLPTVQQMLDSLQIQPPPA